MGVWAASTLLPTSPFLSIYHRRHNILITYHPMPRKDATSLKIRCEACDCSFPPGSLKQHQRGKQHLQNVAPNGHPAPGASPQPSSSPSHVARSNPQPIPPQATSSPPVGGPSTPSGIPRVTVSHEDGLDFVVEGTGSATRPAFSSIDHTVSIEKTGVRSALSVESVTLSPSSGSWYESLP
jgi:hypothetical protein